jgi:hypothetical protein
MVLALAATACGKGDGGDKKAGPAATPPAAPAAQPATVDPEPAATEAPAPQMLDSLGYQIDVPASWTVKQVNENAYSFRLPTDKTNGVTIMPTLQVSRRQAGPASADAAAEDCRGTVGDKEMLEGGAFYYTCKQDAGGITLVEFSYFIPGEQFIYCTGSGGDITATLAACRSLRKPG